MKRLVLLLALPLLAACDAHAPITPEVEALHASVQGLFRVTPSMFPFYSRTEPPSEVGGFAYRTDEWAAVVFYRDPACIPADFNLFEFYDFEWTEVAPDAWIPTPRDRVFACDPTVDGFSLHIEPDGVTPPKQSNLHGNAVPIWFVPWGAGFQQAVEDESLTVAELEAMDGLVKGIATQFREILHTVEFHPMPKINLTARGYLLPEHGGGSFRYNVVWPGLTVDDVRTVQIVIR